MGATGTPPIPAVAELRTWDSGRLVAVEPLAAEHEAGLAQAATDPAMFRWMPADMASSRDALREWLATRLQAAREQREAPHVILAADDRRVLGSSTFLEPRLEHLRVEIGWSWVTPSAWGTGVNVETKLLLMTHAFETVGVRRVEFKTDARNERSRGALLAAGTQFEGIFRKHMVLPGGGVRDSAYYSVIDDEWPDVKQHLRQRLAALADDA